MPSPVRRSARAAPTPSKTPGAPSTSSSSSLASSRHDRKPNGLVKSTTPYSRSSEEISEPPRRSQRSHQIKDDMSVDPIEQDDGNGEDEEEVTRCICGQQDYPGPPKSEAFHDVEIQSDDAGGLFIQCDGCSVWQHGGCVGIIEESQSPDKYYCEECRPKLHDLHVDSRGQKYSIYRPLHAKSLRKSSMSKSDEKAKKERDALLSRASTDPVTGKRRATMRSKEHDDEEEQLRRALEESRREVEGQPNGKKNGKRSRDDSEDHSSKHENKRPRRVSEAPPLVTRTTSQEVESDAERADAGSSRIKKSRIETTQSARHADMREKENEREKMRQEAAGRRQERAGRRRADDDPEEPEESTKATTVNNKDQSPRSSQPASPPPSGLGDRGTTTKRAPVRKGRRLGNNQYTKHRDPTAVLSPHSKRREAGLSSGEEQAGRGDSTTSHSVNKASPVRDTNGGGRGGRIGKGRYKAVNGAAKNDEPIERTFVNMKRSLDFMMAFVAKQQIDMAGDRTPLSFEPPSAQNAGPSLATGGAVQSLDSGSASDMNTQTFGQLNAMEMADIFSRNVEKWNRLYSHLV